MTKRVRRHRWKQYPPGTLPLREYAQRQHMDYYSASRQVHSSQIPCIRIGPYYFVIVDREAYETYRAQRNADRVALQQMQCRLPRPLTSREVLYLLGVRK